MFGPQRVNDKSTWLDKKELTTGVASYNTQTNTHIVSACHRILHMYNTCKNACKICSRSRVHSVVPCIGIQKLQLLYIGGPDMKVLRNYYSAGSPDPAPQVTKWV
jgi:hypothetical protein